jgi:hypothetical protein
LPFAANDDDDATEPIELRLLLVDVVEGGPPSMLKLMVLVVLPMGLVCICNNVVSGEA